MAKKVIRVAIVSLVLVLAVSCMDPVAGDPSEDLPLVSDGDPTLLIDISHNGAKGGFQPYHGMFLASYPGSTLARVELLIASSKGGDATLVLTASKNDYMSGTHPDEVPELIATATETVTLNSTSDANPYKWVAFEFGDVVVAPETVVALELEVNSSDGGAVFFAIDDSTPAENTPLVYITNTDDTMYGPNHKPNHQTSPQTEFDIAHKYFPIRVVGRPAP